jgi:DNA polymerase-2
MNRELEAFILTGTSFENDQKQVIRLYGQSISGSFLVQIDDFRNYFFAEDCFDSSGKNSLLESLNGHKVTKKVAFSQSHLKIQVEEAKNKNLKVFESDIRPLDRYLMDNRLFAQVKIVGDYEEVNGLKTFYNPQILPGDYYPQLKIFSFDIETGKNGQLLSLAYAFVDGDKKRIVETIVLGKNEHQAQAENVFFAATEKEILIFFEKAIKRLDPDVITGWNVIGFDFLFLDKKAKELKHEMYLSRSKKAMNMFQNLRGEWQINLEGRVVIDGPRALKMNFFNFESFKLNAVAKEVVGYGKDIDEDDDYNKWDEIERRFREDKLALAKYNALDAELVLDIFDKVHLIDLLLNRSLISGMLLDRVGGSTAAFDHFYLPDLHEKGVVAPNVEDIGWARQAKGGFVLNPVAGLHDNVLVMDFKSLYPTIIQTFKIDPLSRLRKNENSLSTPAGLMFSKTEHILPRKIEELLDRRQKAKKEKNANLSQAVKILMNSFYGVMGSNGCRFYHEDLPDGITGSGQWILKTVIQYLESRGLKVLYGDTDSIFVQLPSFDKFESHAKELVTEVNSFLSETLLSKFNVESKLEIQYDKFFKRLLLTTIRGQEEGAKKRYAGLVVKSHLDGVCEYDLVLTGMEYVRSDWSKLAREFQYELIRRIFYNEDVILFVEETIKNLEDRKLDHQLILSKRLSKPLAEYVKNVPPHAKAAKMLFEKNGILKKNPQYVMTKRGAVPIELPHDDIDYEYYIDRQIAPIADSLLNLFGKSFEEIRGRQLSLF